MSGSGQLTRATAHFGRCRDIGIAVFCVAGAVAVDGNVGQVTVDAACTSSALGRRSGFPRLPQYAKSGVTALRHSAGLVDRRMDDTTRPESDDEQAADTGRVIREIRQAHLSRAVPGRDGAYRAFARVV